MNPVLIDAIRQRLREQTTEQLLSLWVTNDRAMWSPEAFEAVKSLLAERGVSELPPQNDPAPLAGKHSPAADPAVQYWLAWLRPVLWIAIVIATVALAQQAAGVVETWASGSRPFRFDSPWDLVVGVGTTVFLPTWLLATAIGCLRLVPVARTLLLVFAWTSILLGAGMVVRGAATTMRWQMPWEGQLSMLLTTVLSVLQALTLPVVLVMLLRRREIRSIYVPAGGAGFETTPSRADSLE